VSSVLCRILPALKDFEEGLGDLYPAMKANPAAFQPLFVNATPPLSLQSLRSLYTVEYSEAGSNLHMQEDATVYSFEAFLLQCERELAY